MPDKQYLGSHTIEDESVMAIQKPVSTDIVQRYNGPGPNVVSFWRK